MTIPRALGTLILVQLFAAPAVAEPDPAARAFAKGKQLFEEKRYVGAIEAFEEAYRLKPHFMVQCSIARCYENMNRFVLAAERYQQCLKEGAGASRMAAKITASLEAVEAQISRVTVRSPRPGDEIFVDGRSAGRTPSEVALNPGSHVIEVRREGAKPARETLKTLGGEARTLELAPVELAPAPRPAPGPVTAPATGQAPPEEKPARKGLSRLWFWTGVGVTGALAIAAVALGVTTLQSRSDYEEAPTKPKLDDFKGKRTATNVLWGLTAAAAAGTTVLFFYTDFGGRAEQGRREASFGLGLRGTF